MKQVAVSEQIADLFRPFWVQRTDFPRYKHIESELHGPVCRDVTHNTLRLNGWTTNGEFNRSI
jgi:hypothetical protein